MEGLKRNPDLSVQIGNVVLPNPVGVASGTFGYGQEYSQLVDLQSLGALYTKAVSIEPKAGNKPPRLVETPRGLINSIGLANPGLKVFLDEKLPYLAGLPCPVFVNVVGEAKSEYLAIVEGIEERAGPVCSGAAGTRTSMVEGYELNLSCPNVEKGGMSFGTEYSVVERITKNIRDRTNRVVVVKLSPNVTDIADIAKAAEAGGADAVSCINTVVGMAIDVKACKPLIAVRDAKKTGQLIINDAFPHQRDQCQKNEAEQERDRMRQKAVASAHGSHNWLNCDEEECSEEPQHAK